MKSPGLTIRSATPEDVPLILTFIRELAEYEQLLPEVTADEEGLRQALFGADSSVGVLLAEWDGEPAGFAVFFHNFSTFLGRRGLYVEDVFVRPRFRGHGIGRRLFITLAGIAEQRGCGRMEWAVLDWNEGAIAFYRKLGALPLDEWTVFRLNAEGIRAVARMQ
jgi:GNAT superfamily N-acetyltransferase